MELIKNESDFKIFKKRNGCFAVKNKKGQWINGEEKAKILSQQSLIKISPPKKKKKTISSETREEKKVESNSD